MKKTGDVIRRIAAILLVTVSGLFVLLMVINSAQKNEPEYYASRGPQVDVPQLEALGEDALFNSGSLEDLMELPGIGEIYAGRIIQYREDNGPFYLPEDLMTVKGIGEKRFADIMAWLAEKNAPPAETEAP